MGDFKRSPSKVFCWTDDTSTAWRFHTSGSPGSQDSGFSDTETFPHGATEKQVTIVCIPVKDDSSKAKNSSIAYKDKTLPDKNLNFQLNAKKLNNALEMQNAKARKPLYQKRSRKSLFKADSTKAAHNSNQYAKDGNGRRQISSSVTFEDGNASLQEGIRDTSQQRLNRSAPAVLEVLKENDDERVEHESERSDCDSEIENLFRGSAESPRHTSTPKAGGHQEMRQCKRRAAQNLLLKYERERVHPVDVLSTEENPSVRRWLENIKQLYESECMTTLQCKSISAELTQKVLSLASKITSPLRDVLSQAHLIEKEFDNLNNQTKYKGPLAQNLACTLSEFLQTFEEEVDTTTVCRLCDALRRSTPEEIPRLSSQLRETFVHLRNELLVKRALRLAERLENPTSELEFRATLTGITSLCLRYEQLIDVFINAGAVTTLLIFCEKCDGSSVRIAILRALSTICYNDTAVRQLERASGVQMISEILSDQSRPEPELSESVALLAQITAPWIDGNHQNLLSLQGESKRLVEYLTKFLSTTRCCQNLLLCTAALANITSMNPKCIRHILHQNTVKILLETVQKRGPHASLYLLEQVATLLANISSSEEVRKRLVELRAPAVLLLFLQSVGGANKAEEAEKRMQQKAIIALSRLCSDREAANQLVELDGVKKLVQLCKEKKRRHNSDAVLVAALATLRKIVDCCGINVISAQDAQELVEPRLLDSFLAYSAQNESYV